MKSPICNLLSKEELYEKGNLPLNINTIFNDNLKKFIIKSSHLVLIKKNNEFVIGIPVSYYYIDDSYSLYCLIDVMIEKNIITIDLDDIIFIKETKKNI